MRLRRDLVPLFLIWLLMPCPLFCFLNVYRTAVELIAGESSSQGTKCPSRDCFILDRWKRQCREQVATARNGAPERVCEFDWSIVFDVEHAGTWTGMLLKRLVLCCVYVVRPFIWQDMQSCVLCSHFDNEHYIIVILLNVTFGLASLWFLQVGGFPHGRRQRRSAYFHSERCGCLSLIPVRLCLSSCSMHHPLNHQTTIHESKFSLQAFPLPLLSSFHLLFLPNPLPLFFLFLSLAYPPRPLLLPFPLFHPLSLPFSGSRLQPCPASSGPSS